MKYKVGDKFLAEITEINDSRYPYTLSEIGITTTEENLDKLRRPDDMTADETWKLAGKITEMPCGELTEIFPECKGLYIMRCFSLQEAKARIEAWEAEKEIKVGDVVRADSTKAVILNIHDEYFEVLVEDGCAEEWYKSKVTKTGRHIDIQSLLKQIGGAE